ncbi:hypothetical protein BJ165DRAFT_1529953 [Panaeolus papilionaceus]|nr:hypothetical protein BJ165DRAFT_1529953 [Panaeolus papilionaceus]
MDSPQGSYRPAASASSPLSPVRNSSSQPLLGRGSAPNSPPADYVDSAGYPLKTYQLSDSPNSSEPTGERRVGHAEHVQFATYRSSENVPKIVLGGPTSEEQRSAEREAKTWIPLPLRPYFWIPFVVLLIGLAIGLEVALVFSNRKQGWPSAQSDNKSNALHYVYTLPPVILASFLVAMWAWTDYEIKKIQPYVDLVHGDSPPHRSLLLDYTKENNFIVWTRAAHNRHYLVALASLMVIMTLSFQPLAAALLVVKDIWQQDPATTMSNLQAVGLNQNLQFTDLTSFVTAAGYAGASILYDLDPPSFVQVPYTVAQFQIPTAVKNGTAFANTTVLKSESNCQAVVPNMDQGPTPGSWTNSATVNGCSLTWQVSNSTRTLFGADIAICDNSPPPQFAPVVFWFFTYDPSPQGAISFCFPSFSLWEANVGVDVRTGNVTKVTEIRSFSSSSPFSSLSSNVTGNPLNGRAYNGVMFNLTNPDQFVIARANSTRLQLPAAMYQAALKSPQGFQGSFQTNFFTDLSNEIYSIYLSLIAREVYFLPDSESITVLVKTFRKRVLLSDVAVHLLATALFILAFFGAIIHIFHRDDRRSLRLKHEPGTIASAVTLGAQTGVADVLSGRQGEKDIKEALKNKKFRIDPNTMKIVMEGEYGYEYAKSPVRRRSVFAMLQGGSNPTTPRSAGRHTAPHTPLTPNHPPPS